MSKVIDFKTGIVGDGYTVDPDDVIRGALGEYDSVVIFGISKEGKLLGSASGGRPEAISLLERAKVKLIASFGDGD